ncbi:ABC transporter substrate-binding protein [Sediminicurvatus halobius]|uniref:ABC transporter substrate-binding protein n=1 Tax=Sediminicurvatus halobius TaxID=2182432 RepID=A0A2U2MZA8_9GAMM|nr:ABC transporter substrate-binding protein [Spiribacter halobius]PWG62133.1 ABC transporter substrate-binding protein [Spiribacter halobius]UEX77183.1 ABC transporter substrate-binding protein [Spiribacter halobius]
MNLRIRYRFLTVLALAFGVAAGSVHAQGEEPVRFGVQSWPGVTVKTQVATQLLEAMGYPAETRELSTSVIYQGLRQGDVDVSLGAWMPAHEGMVQPLLEDNAAEQFAVNLEGAVQGLAVTADVYDSGVTSVEALVANGERFDRTIYAIEPGAGMTRAFRAAVENDYKGLGDWQVVPSSVAGMMAQVQRAVDRGEPVVFHGWRPHWMNVRHDIRFLSDDEGSEIADLETTVYTMVRTGWPASHPNAARFLEQFLVPTEAQSVWIHEYDYEERDPETVAAEWIGNNLDVVEGWLEGVETADGKPAIEAVRASF